MEKIDAKTSRTANLEPSNDRRDRRFVSTDVKMDLLEANLSVGSSAESSKSFTELTESNPLENGGSKKRKKRNTLKDNAEAEDEDETQTMDRTNINTGATEIIDEGNVNGKRKRGSRIREEIKINNQVNSLSKSHLSYSNQGEGIQGRVTENECLTEDLEIYAGKESSLLVSVYNKENALDLCTDEEVEISEIKESSLVGQMHTDNHLSLCKDDETVTLPGMVEGSSNQVASGIVEERAEQFPSPIQVEGMFIPCEGEHSSFRWQMAGENVTIENGLNQLIDEVITNEGQCSAEDGSMKGAECLSNNLEHSPGITPIPSFRRKLIVLDVNGLLANIVMPAPRDYRCDTHILGRAIFKRPFCDDFLKFCFQNFAVAVWSSRSKRIIDRVVDYLLGNQKGKLLFCWDMSHSTQTGFNTLENVQKPLVLKELKKIWENDDPSLPWRNGDYNESNTLLLDDSPYKALLNPLYTAIFPNSYHYKDPNDNSLGPGGDIRVYLEGLLSSENVQKHVEQHPFGQSAINETNLSWGFYSDVLQTMSERLLDDAAPNSYLY